MVTSLRRLPAVIGHTGSTGCWLFWCPERDPYFSGGVDEARAGAVPYRIVPRLLFLAGLMFVHTDVSSAIPFPHDIEGFIYLKERYLQNAVVWKLQFEMIVFSRIFGSVSSWILFG